MDAVDAVIKLTICGIVGLIGIYVLASLPAVDGTFAGTAKQVRVGAADAIAWGAVGIGGFVLLIINRFRGT